MVLHARALMPPVDVARENTIADRLLESTRGPRIAIIGAGMAGISCAQTLERSGLHATLFEKSRGPGGRLATRRNEAGEHFDHGAQYITGRDAAFTQWLDTLQVEGSAATWDPRLADSAHQEHHPWLVGAPSMNALLKPVANGLEIHLGRAITTVQRDGQRWRLVTEDGPLPEPFDIVISTAPCPQARALLASDPGLVAQLEAVEVAPCWALMVTFSSPLPVDFDARRFDAGATAWLARQASRPGHAVDSHAWVLHASARWSAEHLELGAEEAANFLKNDFARVIDHAMPEVTFALAHRWRYAMTTQALGQPFVANPDETLFAAGDWCLGARVECAYESGVTVAQAIANRHREVR